MKRFSIALLVLLSLSLLGASPLVRTNGEPNVQGPLHLFDGLIDTTKGIVSEPVMATTEDITLYVRTTGADTNDGLTVGTALLTPQEAVDRVPDSIGHTILIDIGEGTFAGFAISRKFLSAKGKITVSGTLGAPTLTTGTTTGTADGGSTTTLSDSGQNWTVNELRGMLVLVSGQYRVVRNNTDVLINFAGNFTASTSGQAYSILEQKTVVNSNSAKGIGYAPIEVDYCAGRDDININNFHSVATAMGLLAYVTPGAKFTQCKVTGGSWGVLFQQIIGQARIYDCYFSGQSKYGLTSAETFRTDFVRSYVYGCTRDGFYICHGISTHLDYIFADDNGYCGVRLVNSGYVEMTAGGFDGNSQYGIAIGKHEDNKRVWSSELNAAGIVECSDNTLGGVAIDWGSQLAVTALTGTGNGGYGLEVLPGALGVSVQITSATAITGATGDATINGGTTNLTWATDFATDGDTRANVTYGTRIERKD